MKQGTVWRGQKLSPPGEHRHDALARTLASEYVLAWPGLCPQNVYWLGLDFVLRV